jgi:hypothetical protein
MKSGAMVGRAHSLQELCSYDGYAFIRSAYLTVLGRLPDEQGLLFYMGRLDQGVSKLTILHQLRFSSEGRANDPGIGGFDRALKRHRRGTLPFVGWIFRQFTKGESDGVTARERRALMRRVERIEVRLLDIYADLEERLDRFSLQQQPRRSFGIVPATQQSARPWAEISSI